MSPPSGRHEHHNNNYNTTRLLIHVAQSGRVFNQEYSFTTALFLQNDVAHTPFPGEHAIYQVDVIHSDI